MNNSEYRIEKKIVVAVIAFIAIFAILLIVPLAVGQKENDRVQAEIRHNIFAAGEAVAPTCTDEGYTPYACINDGCGYVRRENVVAALGHSLADVVVEPTCTAEGYTVRKCTRDGCGVEDGEKTNVVPKLDHQYGEDGAVCTRCFEIKSDAVDTEGLEYAPVYADDGTTVLSYKVSGKGTAQIKDYIKINGKHENKDVTEIGDGVFADITDLKAVVIPDSVKKLGANCFMGCVALKSIKLGYSFKEIGDGAFGACTGLTSIALPNSVEKIGEDAFKGCGALKTVTVSSSVTSVGGGAFKDCAALTSITLPIGVTSIGLGAFENCSALESMSLPYAAGSSEEPKHFGYIFGAESYEQNNAKVPSSLKTVNVTGGSDIAENAFNGCANIETVNIAGGAIGANAFKGCKGIKVLKLPNGITNIGLGAFENCSAMESISLSYSSMGGKHFGYIFGAESYEQNNAKVPLGLKTVYITGGSTIAENAFNGCANIEKVKTEGGVKKIGKNAFANCAKLGTAALETGITEIGASVFEGCKALKTVMLGSGIKTIGSKAFYGCDALDTVFYNGSISQFGVTEYTDKYSSPLAYSAELYASEDKVLYK